MVLAKRDFNLRGRELADTNAQFIAFSALTRMSGVDLDGRKVRKGAGDSIVKFVKENGGSLPPDLDGIVQKISRAGGTPLVVADTGKVMGVIYLKDIIKQGIRERFARLHAMGLRTVMITGDNPLTAAAIAEESGVDDFVAEATPESKLGIIRSEQAQGKLVAMIGDGTNDAPALAQADVGIAMNAGTQAAREAGNMVDLDSNPTKIMEVVEIGKQLLITRGALTTFSIANDVAKYFAIIPAMFVLGYPAVAGAQHHAPRDAPERDPVGSHFQCADHHRSDSAGAARRGVSSAGRGSDPDAAISLSMELGGVIIPFIGIKAIDIVVEALHLA